MKFSILFKLFVVVALGTYVGLVVNINLSVLNVMLLSSLFLFFAILLIHAFYRKYVIYRITWLPFISYCLFFFWISVLYAALARPEIRPNYFEKIKGDYLSVRVTSIPKYGKNQSQRFEADVLYVWDGSRARRSVGRIMVTVSNQDSINLIRFGDCLKFKKKSYLLKKPLNPYEFRYDIYLRKKGIYALAYLTQDELEFIHHQDILTDCYVQLRKIQSIGVEKFEQYVKNKENAGVASALILGGKWALTPEIINTYSNAGVSHVLAVSGMHVSLLMGIIGYCLYFFNKTRKQKIVISIVSAFLIVLYSFVTGFSAPVSRAVGMILLVLIGNLTRNDSNVLNNLGIIGILTLLIFPYSLFDIGFQFSFVAMLGLLILYPALYDKIKIKNSFLRKLWSVMAVSISAQAATLPLVLYYFGKIPLYFLLGNFGVLVPVFLIMILGFLLLICPFQSGSQVIANVLDLLLAFLNTGLKYIEEFPAANILFPKMIFPFYCLLALMLWLLSLYLHFKKIIYRTLALILFSGICSIYLSTLYRNYRISGIRIFNVGRNYAIGLIHQSRAILLSDLDSTSSQIKNKASPYLSAKGLLCLANYRLSDSISFIHYKKSNLDIHQFKDYRFLIVDSCWNGSFEYNKLDVCDLIYIVGDIHPNNKHLSLMSDKTIVVVKAGLKLGVTQAWRNISSRQKLPFIDLNNSPSFEISF